MGIPAPSSGSGSRVYGIVFLDRNQNGSFDGGDTRLSNETVYLHNTPGTQVLGTTATDGSGGYSFDRLAGGDYRIIHYVPSGYVRTTDDSRPFSVPPDQNWNFGIFGSAPLPPPSPLPPPPPPLGDENSGTGGTGLPPSIPFLQQAPAGPGGAGAPQLPQCSDGIDNDNDGLIDLSDPGCSSPSDNNEYNFRIREIIPDFFNLNWFKLNISNLLETRALGKQ
ncbi:MAG: hypothetical protein HYW38_02415 [Candidatus Colwellbacteria bacterium]|nr:hypothetical protein [Candidatus Colwellbacteria bacterium]